MLSASKASSAWSRQRDTGFFQLLAAAAVEVVVERLARIQLALDAVEPGGE
jgi:hypothetical protein